MVARWRELFGLDNERSSSPCCIGSSAGGRDTWLTLVLDPVRGVKQKAWTALIGVFLVYSWLPGSVE